MKVNFVKIKIAFFLIFLSYNTIYSQNLLSNGSFEAVGIVGFDINGAGYTQIFAPFTGNSTTGNFAITTDPQPMNTAFFISGGDHTTGAGNMLVIDGNTTGGQQAFWSAGNNGSGVCGLTPGAIYTFSYWMKSVASTVTGLATQANIGIQMINASSVTLVSGSVTAPLPALGWQQVVYTFVPTSPCVNIKLWNNNTNPVGNDFAVDDFEVRLLPQPLSISYSVSNASCPNADDGVIVVTGINGIVPYVSYSITGPISQTNFNGIFTGLVPGTYSASVTDSNSPAATANVANIIVSEPSNLTVSSATTICSGAPITLSASGSSSGYTWTASPADATLTAPNTANPTVSPTQTTTYTVQSASTITTQLISNGNFSQGNVGFTTDYQYLTTTVSTGSQKTYGIVTNSDTWFGGFHSCLARNGSGNMMVVDGSTLNAGNDRVWCQTVPVALGQTYTFSYWVQSVAAGNPANLDVVINGVSVGTSFVSGPTCNWVQKTYTWSSLANTTAQICIYDRTITSGGNDFALDDITFTTAVTCNLSNSVEITVNPTLSPVISCGTPTDSSVTFTWPAVSGATNYGVVYSINNGPSINAGSSPLTTFTVSSLNTNDTVQIFVIPSGGGPSCFSVSNQTCTVIAPCVVPDVSVTVQPTCTTPTGTIVFTSPLNNSPLPNSTNLFISEVTDEDVGALTYVEIFNGTGSAKNLANYKLKIYNNGNTFTSCEFPLSGILNNGAVYVISVGSVTNQGGVIPDLVVSTCAGVNNNDNIRLTTSSDIEIDLWGRTDGAIFTPANSPGYTFRRLVTAPHPSMTWNIADWTSFDPQVYSNIGNYIYQTALYEYSVNGTVYQSSPTFSGLAPNTYNVTIRDLVSGCISTPISLTVSQLPTIAPPTASVTVQPTCSIPTGTIVVTVPIGANFQYSINGINYQSNATFTGLVPTTYNVTVKNTTTGCVSAATQVSITTIPTIVAPTASATVQPTCSNPTGTIVISAPTGVNFQYSINGTNYQSIDTFSGLAPNTYNVTVKNILTGCISIPTQVTINPIPTVAIPTASVTQQPNCQDTTGTIVVTSPLGANFQYSIDGVNYQSGPTFSGLIPDIYDITVKNSTNDCISAALQITINSIPANPSIPLLSIVNPGCTSTFGTVTVTSPIGVDFEYLLDGLNFQSSPIFLNLALGTHSIIVRQISTGCISTVTYFDIIQLGNDVIVNTPLPLEYCDPNNDGTGIFDLTQVINSVTGGNTNYTVTFHETYTDADVDGTSITDPVAYNNINFDTQIIYIRIESNLTACYSIVTLQLIVNPTPEATEPLDYHLCDDNYDGFASFDLTTITSEVLGSIDPLTHLVTYYTDLAGAELGTNPINNVTNYTNVIIDTQPLWVRVETIATGCIDIVELQLVVDPLPQATQPNYPQYSLCETALSPIGYEQFDLGSQIDAISLGQTGMNITFHLSQAEADLDSNALPLLYTNQAQYVQTLWIRIENDATGCYVLSTMDIRVEPLPSPIPPPEPYSICDDNQDGLSEFDLTTLTAAILQGGNYTITYHETAIDASLGDNPLASPYQNIYPFIQILYVAAVDPLTGCSYVMPIELNVSPSPVMPTTLPNLTNCDQDSNNQSASTSFDLTQQSALILAAQQTAAINYTVTYYTSQPNAENGIAPIIPATNYTGSNGQTIWVRVTHNTTDCYNIGSFQLLVDIPLLLTTPLPLSICDNDSNPNDLYTTFDLTVKDDEITQGLPGYTVTYYSTYPVTASSVAIATPTAYTNTSPAVQTLGVMVTSPEGCISYITLDIRVLPVPVPQTNPPALAPQCDDNNPGDMLETFDLTTNAAYIINNDPNITLHYFESQADAIANVNEILLPATALVGGLIIADQSVWIRVENNRVDYLGNNCYVLVEQLLTVNPLPSIATIADYQICEDDLVTNDGFEVFDLTSQAAALLASNPTTSTYTLTYHTATPPTAANQISTPSVYTNTSNPQTIYVVAINDGTGCISQVGQFTILVNPRPEFTQPTTLLTTCDSDGTNDGEFAYPLDTTITTEILNGQDPTLFAVTFYDSEFNPDATPPLLPTAISDLANYQGYTHTIWAAVTNIATGCQKTGSFEAIVEQLPEPEITTVNNINTICVDFRNDVVIRELTLTAINNTVYLDPTTIPTPSFEYHWFEDGVEVGVSTTNTYTITQPLNDTTSSMFTVEMVNMTTLGCSQSATNFEVIQSGPASIPVGTAGYTVTNAFEQNQTITVEIEGYGTYQYSLDQGPRQDSTVFENVALGEHTITIWDTEGGLEYSCDSVILYDVQIIDYPHYFTPNGDGIHDTWNIFGLSGQPAAKIYIFDRYGKLLKQISSKGQGWDGTFNGKLLPSTDYWFTVDFMETSKAKQFKAHFSLKR